MNNPRQTDAEFLNNLEAYVRTHRHDADVMLFHNRLRRLARLSGMKQEQLAIYDNGKWRREHKIKCYTLLDAIKKARKIMSEFSAAEAIKTAVMTAPGKSWPTYDGSNLTRYHYVTASEVGKCARSLCFQKHEERATVQIDNFWETMTDTEFENKLAQIKDDSPLGFFARGDHMEAWIVEQLLAVQQDHEEFMHMGGDQVSYHTNKALSGTPDGIYLNSLTGEMWLLEFKSSGYMPNGPKQEHIKQCQLNMGIIKTLIDQGKITIAIEGEPVTEFAGAKLVYVNASNYCNIQEYSIEYDGGETYAKGFAKVKKVFKDTKGTLRQPKNVEPEGILDSGIGCKFCQYQEDCLAIERAADRKAVADKLDRALTGAMPKPMAAMPEFKMDKREEVIKVLAKYKEFSEEESEAKKQKKVLAEKIREWVEKETEGKDTMAVEFTDDGKIFSASVSTVVTKGGLNKTKIEELINAQKLKFDDFCNSDSESTRLNVSVREVK